jgi:acyl carrier protein
VLGQHATTGPAPRRTGPPPPASDPAAVVAAVYEDVLGIAAADPDRGFFELGGDSLQAIQAASRLSEVFGRELAAETLFDHSSGAARATSSPAPAASRPRSPTGLPGGSADGRRAAGPFAGRLAGRRRHPVAAQCLPG